MIPLLDFLQPTLDAFLTPNIPFSYRWRLLAFQPIALLTLLLNGIPCSLSRRTQTIYIPTRSGPKRCLVWRPQSKAPSTTSSLPPLHLDIHGGGFIGGDPSAGFRFCSTLADRTGAVVIGASYRFAPRYSFPAAIDDIDDIVSWLQINASSHSLIHANPFLFTASGSSAGGNLALAAAQALACRGDNRMRVKASVTFYAPIDLRPPPWKKPAPPSIPKNDPMAFLQPLFDTYAGLGELKGGSRDNPRCSPILADVRMLPEKMLLIVPTVDILVHEQLAFVERVKKEIDELQVKGEGRGREIRAKVMEGCFHGWLELPDAVLNSSVWWKGTREESFAECTEFIKNVHEAYGYRYRPE